ncbi:MAG: hypothetical protein JKY96_07920 [Phycisphaerales bacterium]|nr:hypothetical protein [Phycisphaerales bacterium]
MPILLASFLPIIFSLVILAFIGLDLFTARQIINNRVWFLVMLLSGPILSLLWSAVILRRTMRYTKRFKARNGKLCFACDYDLLDNQTRCPECGADWDPEPLGKPWKKWVK